MYRFGRRLWWLGLVMKGYYRIFKGICPTTQASFRSSSFVFSLAACDSFPCSFAEKELWYKGDPLWKSPPESRFWTPIFHVAFLQAGKGLEGSPLDSHKPTSAALGRLLAANTSALKGFTNSYLRPQWNPVPSQIFFYARVGASPSHRNLASSKSDQPIHSSAFQTRWQPHPQKWIHWVTTN